MRVRFYTGGFAVVDSGLTGLFDGSLDIDRQW